MEHTDVCIIGSGFGGAIAAARLGALSAAGPALSIRVLERGHDFFDFDPSTTWKWRNAQGNGFRQTVEPGYYGNLLSIYTEDEKLGVPGESPSFSVIAGNGIGGSSLVYLAIKLRAPSATFEQADAGRRLWPAEYSRQTLNTYYQRVEAALRVTRLKWTGPPGSWDLTTRRDRVFAEGCLRIGATSEPLKIALQGGRDEGFWSTGNRFGGRQHLPVNYLADARQRGVRFDSDCEVSRIAPDGSGYVVTYHDKRSDTEATLSCRLLVVSAGAIGSTGILLRSQGAFTGDRNLSDHLGRHISGNGDYGMVGVVGPEHQVDSYRGKQMASFCPSFWDEHRFVLVPFYAPPMPMAFGQPAAFAYAADPAAVGRASTRPATPTFGLAYKQLMKTFGSRVLTVAALAWDRCEGEASIGRFDRVNLSWPTTHPDTEQRWSTAVQKTRAIFNALGGELLLDVYRHQGHVITAHPLGGCRMADQPSDGVVDPRGEVWGNRNLFVLDASIVPSAIGVHPSLTIAAVAEHAVDALLPTVRDRLS